MINRKHCLPILRQCKALKVHRTTICREPKPVKQEKLDLMKVIDKVHLEEPAWGVRKVRQYLIESGVPVGRRHCTTLFRTLGIHCIYRKPRTTIRHIGHNIYPYLLRHLEIVKPYQVWATDITYIPMAKGFVYLTCVMDIYSRNILSSVISSTLDASFCVEAYAEAVRLHGAPGIINTDQGSQFTSDAYVAAVAVSGAKLSMDERGAWTDNNFIERFWRSLKYAEVYLRAYGTVADAKRFINRHINKYNAIRPHASLGGKTPDNIHAIAPAEGLLKAS
jgi:putative transposase